MLKRIVIALIIIMVVIVLIFSIYFLGFSTIENQLNAISHDLSHRNVDEFNKYFTKDAIISYIEINQNEQIIGKYHEIASDLKQYICAEQAPIVNMRYIFDGSINKKYDISFFRAYCQIPSTVQYYDGTGDEWILKMTLVRSNLLNFKISKLVISEISRAGTTGTRNSNTIHLIEQLRDKMTK